MCLIVFAYRTHPKYQLVLAANRDEFYERPSATAQWWGDQPNILGGRDLKARGTWMALDKSGRFAAVTNFRDPQNIRDDVRSRGDLPVRFLLGKENALEYSKSVFEAGSQYNGFNLLTMDSKGMCHVSNYDKKVNDLPSGIHGLSNALLNTNWPKVEKAKALITETISVDFAPEDLVRAMQDTSKAEDDVLPSTGVPYEWEKSLSSMCIRTGNYGTCCSTAITVDYKGNVVFYEQSFPVGARKNELQSHTFKIGP